MVLSYIYLYNAFSQKFLPIFVHNRRRYRVVGITLGDVKNLCYGKDGKHGLMVKRMLEWIVWMGVEHKDLVRRP